MKAVYWVLPDGRLEMLGDDTLDLGPVIGRRRASHIVPAMLPKRIAFRLLRLAFGERGKVADWSRSWRGPWLGIIVGSKRRFVHASRRVVLAWEKEVLESE